tara:strand:- start:1637 stop:2143 length:507 start_codon:yes stop_codon:yes gene_type:complete
MKKLLQILLLSIILLGCTSEKDITSFNQMGEKFFQIIDNIEKSSYLEFRQNFLSRKEVINILNDSKFPKEGKINKLYIQFLNMSNEEYDSGLKIDKESYEGIKEYITSLKKKGRFQFNDFEVTVDPIGLIDIYDGNLKWKIIGDEDKLKNGHSIFIIYNEVYYPLGFD